MNLTPQALQDSLYKISDELFESCAEMATIAERKGTAWLEIKNGNNGELTDKTNALTNAEVDKLWDASVAGRRENYLKWYIKGLTAKRGAILQEIKAHNNSY